LGWRVKESVHVSVVQFAPQRWDREANAIRMADFIEREGSERAELVVFPELANIGYLRGPNASLDEDFALRYHRYAEPIPGPTTSTLGKAAAQAGVYVVVGLAEAHPHVPGMLFNSSVLIAPDGEVRGVHRKVHIPRAEKHYFVPGNRIEVFPTELGVIGMQVCYDDRFPETARVQALKGAEIIVVVFAGYLREIGRRYGQRSGRALAHRASTRALENAVYYVICNRSGSEDDSVSMGHSVVAGPAGTILCQSASVEETVSRAELREEHLIGARISLSTFRDRRPDLYGPIAVSLDEIETR
jgi:omega-amidase